MGCFCGKEALEIESTRYYARSRLGEGGFSFVDLVESVRTHKLHAMKKILCHSQEDQDTALREVRYMKMFNHPNIIGCDGSEVVPVTGRGSIISEVLILMPYHKSGTVQDMIDKKEPLEETFIIDTFAGICKGVAEMHGRSPPLAHRDLKPANVLIADNCVPVIMDLGSMAEARIHVTNSSQAQALQDVASERCSMPFRAPELFHVERDSMITESTDIWSLGCTLYAMVYLKSPFEEVYTRGDSLALAATGGNVKYPPQSRYCPQLIDLIKSMLVVEPTARPAIATIIERLEATRGNRTVVGPAAVHLAMQGHA